MSRHLRHLALAKAHTRHRSNAKAGRIGVRLRAYRKASAYLHSAYLHLAMEVSAAEMPFSENT
jgi:hypothetical protein